MFFSFLETRGLDSSDFFFFSLLMQTLSSGSGTWRGAGGGVTMDNPGPRLEVK